ncbi:MAG: radical SAM protein [Thermocrispum sp.]
MLITGGEPFLHNDLGEMIEAVVEHVPVTVLTNGMVFHRGNRRRTLEALDRDLVTLQISLDSATPELHDQHRGAGSYARAREGIALARSLGFRVRVATLLRTARRALQRDRTRADLRAALRTRHRRDEHLTPAGLIQPFTWVVLKPAR